jgi:hypothetical protein
MELLMSIIAISIAFNWATQAAVLEAQLARFPPPDVTNAWLEFNQKHFEAMLAVHNQATKKIESLFWLNDIEKHREPWERLQRAQDRTQPLASRRYNYLSLSVIGKEDFIQGHMPPAVPLDRFVCGKPPFVLTIPQHPPKAD